MSTPERTRRDGKRGRRPVVRAIVIVLGVLLVFLLGVAFARTLDDRPRTSGNETTVRTLAPRPQDAPRETVTVTVTATSP